jgi:hypothetical protein
MQPVFEGRRRIDITEFEIRHSNGMLAGVTSWRAGFDGRLAESDGQYAVSIFKIEYRLYPHGFPCSISLHYYSCFLQTSIPVF